MRAGDAAGRRVLVINPNTNLAVTERVRRLATPGLCQGTALDVVNPPAGPTSIETADDRTVAEGHVLALVRNLAGAPYDACALACFDDIALEPLRALTGVPVVGPCEAGMAAVRALSARFLILTTVDAAVPGIRALMQRYGAGPQARVRAAGIGVAAAADADEDTWQRLLDTVHASLREDGIEAVLLGSGGLAGQAPRLAEATGLPVVDAVEAAMARAVALALS